MDRLKKTLNGIQKKIAQLLDFPAPTDETVIKEPVEQEVHVDILLNPLQGVDVLRHAVNQRPRRA